MAKPPFEPLHVSTSCLDRSQKFLDLAADPNLPDSDMADDLVRTALVMALAAVDSYMHWLVFRRLSESKNSPPKSLAKMEVPFSELAGLARNVVTDRNMGVKSRPWVQVKNAAQRALLSETFQSYEQVANAMALAGIVKGWSKVSKNFGTPSGEIKERLNGMTHRRNRIVHEGDVRRSSRPREVKFNKVFASAVQADVNWIRDLIAQIDNVAKNDPK